MKTVTAAILLLSALPLIYYLLSIYCVVNHFLRRSKKAAVPNAPAPPVSILKPVRGVDYEAYENFASFCRQDYPQYELLFAVSDPEDPAIGVIEKLQADFPCCSIRLVSQVPSIGTSDKVNKLCELTRNAKHEILVMSDSDVRVTPSYLREVVNALCEEGVGVVTAFYRSAGAGTLASNLDALGMYMDSAPAALVAKKLEGKLNFAFGWTMATTKKHLAEIGGWEAMSNHHSEDFELGKRIAARGHQVVLLDEPVSMVFSSERITDYFQRELRWSISLKSARPSGYRALLFTQGLPWAIIGAVTCYALGDPIWAISYVLAYFFLRVSLTLITGSWGLGDRRLAKVFWLIPARDAVSFVVWIAGFFSERVVWRGIEYTLRKGQLIPVTKNASPVPAQSGPVSSALR